MRLKCKKPKTAKMKKRPTVRPSPGDRALWFRVAE